MSCCIINQQRSSVRYRLPLSTEHGVPFRIVSTTTLNWLTISAIRTHCLSMAAATRISSAPSRGCGTTQTFHVAVSFHYSSVCVVMPPPQPQLRYRDLVFGHIRYLKMSVKNYLVRHCAVFDTRQRVTGFQNFISILGFWKFLCLSAKLFD